MVNLSVEELVEINDFFNGASKIKITYVTDNIVLLELFDGGVTDGFVLSKRDLIMVLRNFYVEDICDIVNSGVQGYMEVRVAKSVKHYPVEITVEDGYKYYCNLKELDYIRRLVNRQRDQVTN